MKSVFSIFSTLLVAMCLFSCSAEEEVFSCDPEVNEWVNSNRKEIREMQRGEWLGLDEDFKIPTLRAFSEEQLVDFWLLKIEELLELDWNSLEREHIQKLAKQIQSHPEWFQEDITEKSKDELDIFHYEWIEYAKEELGWTPNQVASMVYTGNRVLDKRGNIVTVGETIRTKSSSEPTCDCNWSTNACGLQFKACAKTGGIVNCKIKSPGCGFLNRDTCNGLCIR